MNSSARRLLIAGNWKMNGTQAALAQASSIAQAASPHADVVLCPPATLIERMVQAVKQTHVQVGGQDCHAKSSGAHTGDVSAAMLKDAGASWVIVGHSERRAEHHETSALIQAKAQAALAEELHVIVCVGETLQEREDGQALDVVGRQLEGSLPVSFTAQQLVIAYEPVWAIGTGKTPTLDDIASVHGFIRAQLRLKIGTQAEQLRILYGGSVKPENARQILALEDVDGALVGGASLKAADFLPILQAAG